MCLISVKLNSQQEWGDREVVVFHHKTDLCNGQIIIVQLAIRMNYKVSNVNILQRGCTIYEKKHCYECVLVPKTNFFSCTLQVEELPHSYTRHG